MSAKDALGGRPVLLITLGGTIAMSSVPDGGLSVALDTAALVAGLADKLAAPVEAEALRAMPSSQIHLSDVIELAAIIEERLATGRYAGVVVTQGTDTLEESAFALDLLVASVRPVVVTGAMRAPGQPGSDAAANLVAAVAVAASEVACNLGTLVVMNDEIHAARLVRKTHTASPAAFVSTPGPLGWVSEGRAHLALVPARRMQLPARPEARWRGSVPLVAVGMGDDGTMIEQLVRQAPDGLVIAALGAGHVPAELVSALAELAAKLPVVLTSRAGAGQMPDRAYDFPGSESDLFRRGLVSGSWLDPWKCRVLLELLLRSGDPSPAATFAGVIASGVARS